MKNFSFESILIFLEWNIDNGAMMEWESSTFPVFLQQNTQKTMTLFWLIQLQIIQTLILDHNCGIVNDAEPVSKLEHDMLPAQEIKIKLTLVLMKISQTRN